MSVVQSGGLRLEICVLHLSHAMLVLAELIVCSTRGFACILAKWFWPTVMSLSLTYGSPEDEAFRKSDAYFGRRSNERVLEQSVRNSYGENNPILKYWSYTLSVDL